MHVMSAGEHPLTVTFWGVRGSVPTPGTGTSKYGGNTACLSVTCGDTTVVLDAGTGIRPLGAHLMAARHDDPHHRPCYHLLLSHTHWDHIQGLPFFAPAYVAGTTLTIYGAAKRERFLSRILQGQMDENYFPVQMKMLAANVTIREIGKDVLQIGPLAIRTQPQVFHPGGTLRFRITCGDRSIVYATDVEIDQPEGAPDDVAAERAAADARYRDFVKGADLLIGDGQYSETEYASKQGWGHTSIPVLIRTAAESAVKRVAVFHHDPDHDDDQLDRFQATYAPDGRAAAGGPEVFWAREGLSVTLP